jgi:hypothetical protein
MPALANDSARCEVMNLGWGAQGHGPYLVRQEGHVPGGSDLRPQRFILQKDDRWLLNLAFVLMPETEQEQQLFHTLTEVLLFLDELSGRPVRVDAALPPGIDEAEILAQFEACTRRLLRGLRDCEVRPLVRPA